MTTWKRILGIAGAVLMAFIIFGSTLAMAQTATAVARQPTTAQTMGDASTLLSAAWDVQFGVPPGGNGLNGEVVAIAADSSGNLYVGGNFNQAGSTTAYNIAMWDGTTWHALIDGNGYNGLSGDVWAIAINPANGDVFVGGIFARIDGNNAGPLACRIARWSPATAAWSTLQDSSGFLGVDGSIHALAVMGDELFVGGSFDGAATSSSCGTANVAAPGLASWHIGNATWSDVGGSMGSNFPKVNALTSDGSTLYAGGFFDMAGGAPATNVARWDGSSWTALASGIDGEIEALALAGSTLYAGGTFTQTGSGGSANYVAQWDDALWSSLGSGIGGVCLPGLLSVKDMLVQGNHVYAAGLFQSAGGVSANNIAMWDTAVHTWSALGDGLGIQPVFPCEAVDYVNALAWGSVYAGGTFTNSGSLVTSHFARWVTAVPSYAVSLLPATAVGSTPPGSIVTYSLQIRNDGSEPDSYDLLLGAHNFPTQINPTSVGPLLPNGSATAVVSVTIPGTAHAGDSDTVIVTATSQTDANIFDQSHLTSQAYVAPDCQTIVNEQFESGDIPAGWLVVDNLSGGQVWRFDDPAGRGNLTGGAGGFAIIDSDFEAGMQDTELHTPLYDLSTATAVSLTFNTDFRWYVGGDDEKADVDISTDGGTNWINVWQKTGADYRGPVTETVNLNALAAGNSVIVRFHYYNANFDWWWQVDNVTLTRCNPPIPDDSLILGNLVWDDSDGDGLFEPGHGEQGISEILLNLYEDTNHNNQFDILNDAFITSTSTDAAGHYTFTRLAANDYIVQVAPANFSGPSAPLFNRVSSSGNGLPAPDPDDDLDNDDNGDDIAGQGSTAQAITLNYGSEPINDGDANADSNLTLDFGFTRDSLITGQKFEDADGDGAYLLPRDYAVVAESDRATWGDLNGDGRMDAMVIGHSASFSLLLGRSNGTFAPDVRMNTSTAVGFWLDVDSGDVNHDGFLDLVATIILSASPLSDNIMVLLGQGGGTFAPALTFDTAGYPAHLEMADLNGDTHLDLAVGFRDTKVLAVYFGDGHGRFPIPNAQIMPVSGGTYDLALADVDNDNDLDLVAVASNDVVIGLNNGSGSFSLTLYPQPQPEHFSLGDVDNDNDLDILFIATNSARLLINGGDGTFTAGPAQTIAPDVHDVVLAEVNGNHIDLLLAYTNTVEIMTGNGNGTFGAAASHSIGAAISELHVLDVDSDGRLDLVTVNRATAGSISRLFGDGQGGFTAHRPETGLPNWTIFLDENGNDVLDGGEASQLTDAGGHYTFTRLVSGTYHVREVQQAGWQQTTANGATVVSGQQTITNVNIGNFHLMTISGTVYHDRNENGSRDGGEPALAGRNLFLDDNHNGVQDTGEVTATTDVHGRYAFTALPPNTFFVRQMLPAGWKATTGQVHILPAISQQAMVVDFGNAPISVYGRKFDDVDGNGRSQPIFTFDAAPRLAATGDINGDGYVDAVVQEWGISILLGRADGTLQPPLKQPLAVASSSGSHTPSDIELADLNGDNFDDIIVTMFHHPAYAITQVVTLLSQGNGSFGPPTRHASGSTLPQEVEVADLNGDGHLDLVVANTTHGAGGPITDTISVFINKGDGRFKTRTDYFVPHNGRLVKLADMDGDGDMDIIASNNNVVVLLNDNGLFNNRINLSTNGTAAAYLALSDIDSNGFPDVLIIPAMPSTNVLIFPNNGNGTFAPHTTLSIDGLVVDHAAEGLTTSDINNDTHTDLLIPLSTNTIGVFLGSGTGSFSSRKDYPVGDEPQAALVTDFDQDGNPDLWVINGGSKDAYLLAGDGAGRFALTPDASLPNWAIYLDNNSNNILDGGDISTTTNAQGHYTITAVLPNYRPREVNQPDWVQTAVPSPTNMLPAAKDLTGVDFGNFKLATISGTVYHDLNFSRRLEPGEAGVAGWIVFLDNNQNGTLDGGEPSITTDSSGHYSFTHVPPSHQYLRLVLPGGWQASKPLPERVAPGSGQTMIVHLGVYQPVDVGDFVWRDLNGDGLQDAGEPGIENALVSLYTAVGHRLLTQTTNISGGYTFASVNPGAYIISFTLPVGYLFSPQDQGMFDFNDSDVNVVTGQTAVFTLTSGIDQNTWDAGMYRSALIGDRVWADANYNGIQDSGETGVSGITVTLYVTTNTTPFNTTTTDVNGDYSFFVPPGTYRLMFERPTGYIFTHPDVAADDVDSDADAGGNTIPFTVSENEQRLDWDAGLVALTAVGNRVWFDVNGDGIQDSEEPGQPGITVTLHNSGGLVATQITNGDGHYTFTNVIPGSYTIKVEKPTGWEYSPKQNPGAPDNDHDSDVDQTTGETDTFTLNPGQVDITQDAGLYPLPATIGDRVWHDLNADGIQDTGEPGLISVTVNLYYAGNTLPYATQTTDANGHYTFTNILPGDYYLSFNPPGGYYLSPRDQGGDDTRDSDPDATPSSPTFAQTISFTVSAGDTITKWDAGVYQLGTIGNYVWLDLNFDGLQSITETQINAITSFLTVTLTRGDFVISTTHTDIRGHYTFTNLFPGSYALQFPPHSTFAPPELIHLTLQDQGGDDTIDSDADPVSGKTTTFTLTSGQQVYDWDAGYVAYGTLKMEVKRDNDLDGYAEQPVANITVHLLDATTNAVLKTTLTDGSGNAYFNVPWTESYKMQVEKPNGYLFAPRGFQAIDFDLTSGKTRVYSLVLPLSTHGETVIVYQPGGSGSVLPGSGGMVQIANNQGDLTTAQFIPGAVTTNTTAYLTNLAGGSVQTMLRATSGITPTFDPPQGYAATNHEIYVDATQAGGQVPGLQFAVPATLTITYSDADVAGVDENSLRLFYRDWESEGWIEAAAVCITPFTPQIDKTANVVTAVLCQTGRYALFGRPGHTSFSLFLPVITRP